MAKKEYPLIEGYRFNSANNRRQRRLAAKRSGYLRAGKWKMFVISPENNVQTVVKKQPLTVTA